MLVIGGMYHEGKQAQIGLRLPVSGPETPSKVVRCFRQLKSDPERQSEIDPPYITQKAVEQINLTQPIFSWNSRRSC